MIKALALTVSTARTKILVFSSLIIITVFLPMVIHSQFVTGPLINMALILAVFFFGPFEAVFLGLIPSVVALSSGLLPLPLAPMVPFIMIGNAILIGTYHYFGPKKFGLAIFFAAFFKFIFLYSIVVLLMNTLLAEKLVAKLAVMMSWPQLATAIIGGLLAYPILKKFNKI